MRREEYFTRGIKSPQYFYFEIPKEAPSVNHIWLTAGRGGARRLSQKAIAFYKLAQGYIFPKRIPDDWQSAVVRICVAPKARRGDVDNRIKAVLDALTKALFWKDDSVVSEVSCVFEEPIGGDGRTRILITPGGEKFPSFQEVKEDD